MDLTQANREEMNQVFQSMLEDSKGNHSKGLDQLLLAQYLWPIAQNDMICHDSYHCNVFKSPFNRPFPTQRKSGPDFSYIEEWNFVGSNGGTIYLDAWDSTMLCPEECRPKEHQDWLLC